MADPETTQTSTPPPIWPGDFGRVLRDQRKTLVVAFVLAVAAYWVLGQLGEWRLAGCIAGGVGLGLLNHLATEYWLLRMITSGEQPTRNKLAMSTLVRLAGRCPWWRWGSRCGSGPTASACCSAWPSSA